MQWLRTMEFSPLKSDSSLFIRPSRAEPISILLYIDNLIITGADLGEITCIKSQLAASSERRISETFHYFFRIEVIRAPEGILISQSHYMLNMLFKFEMVDCQSVSTPFDKNVTPRRDLGKACDPTRFGQIVRSLIYLTITQSNLSYPVSLINQFMSQPKTEHL